MEQIRNDVGVKRYFDPSDAELLRALHSRNSKNIRNPLIFLQKMASYSCFVEIKKYRKSEIMLKIPCRQQYEKITISACKR